MRSITTATTLLEKHNAMNWAIVAFVLQTLIFSAPLFVRMGGFEQRVEVLETRGSTPLNRHAEEAYTRDLATADRLARIETKLDAILDALRRQE